MRRRRILVSIVASAVVLAACGSGSATPSPEPSPSAAAVTASPAPPPSPSQPAESVATTTTMRAACEGVSLRKKASTEAPVIVRLAAGTKVRVVEIVKGDAYTAGACGSDGNTWLKIDRVAGKKAKAQYGVKYVYAAAGLFK